MAFVEVVEETFEKRSRLTLLAWAVLCEAVEEELKGSGCIETDLRDQNILNWLSFKSPRSERFVQLIQ